MQQTKYPYYGLFTYEGMDNDGIEGVFRTIVRFTREKHGMQVYTETCHTEDTGVEDLDWHEEGFTPISEEEANKIINN